MSIHTEIERLYFEHGDKCIYPYIGSSFLKEEDALRVMSIGFNAYISDGDWPKDLHKLRGWYRGWWSEVKPHGFFKYASEQCDVLAEALVVSPFFNACSYSGKVRDHMYGTNMIKVFKSEQYKKSSSLKTSDYKKFVPTWRKELDIMAANNVLPHVIVSYGSAFWKHIWQAFNIYVKNRVPQYENYRIVHYKTCGDNASSCFHNANLVEVKLKMLEKEISQSIVVICLHHPSARVTSSRRKDASWLLCQNDFQKLLRLG